MTNRLQLIDQKFKPIKRSNTKKAVNNNRSSIPKNIYNNYAVYINKYTDYLYKLLFYIY